MVFNSKMVVSEGLAFHPKDVQYVRVVQTNTAGVRCAVQIGFKNRDMLIYATDMVKKDAEAKFTELISKIEEAQAYIADAAKAPSDQVKGKLSPGFEHLPDGVEMQTY